MKNITVKVGIGFALAWCTVKYLMYLYDPFSEIHVAVMINILFLLLSISIGLYLLKSKSSEESNALLDIKNGLRAGLPYVILVSLFIYVYYAKINPEYTQRLVNNRLFEMEQKLNDPNTLEEFKAANPKYELKTKEEIFKEMKESPENILSPGFTTTVSLLSLLLLAVLYSILVTVVYRRIVFRH